MADGLGTHQRAADARPFIARNPSESAQFYNFLKSYHILVAAVMQVMRSDTCGPLLRPAKVERFWRVLEISSLATRKEVVPEHCRRDLCMPPLEKAAQ